MEVLTEELAKAVVPAREVCCLKTATSRFVLLENFSLNFSCSSFAIRGNLLYPYPSLFLNLCGVCHPLQTIVLRFYST